MKHKYFIENDSGDIMVMTIQGDHHSVRILDAKINAVLLPAGWRVKQSKILGKP
jgi:hypothetical protein